MRILVLNYEYPPLGGGAGVITQNISQRLANRGHLITVLTTWFNGEETDSRHENLRIIRLKSKRKVIYKSNPVEMLSWMFAAKNYLKKHLVTNKYDICFANFALPGGEVAYSMKLQFGLPYLVMSHGHDIPWFMPEQMMWYHAFTYHWIRKICLQSVRNYVQSQDMKDNIDAFLGKSFNDKNKIIYNGWDSSVFKPDYSIRNVNFTILFPGRLVGQKDPMSFLKAIKIVQTKIPKLIVHITGDGKLRKKMEKFVNKNKLNDNVVFKSWISKSEMLYEYQSASVTVLPSLNEGMSIATLEALASGQYVIATKVSNNESLILPGVNGDFIEKRNPLQIATQILNFYYSKFLNNYKISDENLSKYHSICEWDKIIDEYENDLREITKK